MFTGSTQGGQQRVAHVLLVLFGPFLGLRRRDKTWEWKSIAWGQAWV